MPSIRQINTQRKHNNIRARYKALKGIIEHGVQKHSTQWIIATLANEFYLSVGQIENIVWSKPAPQGVNNDLFSATSGSLA